MNKIYHPYHMVNPSPWPYLVSCSILLITIGAMIYFHYNKLILLLIGVILLMMLTSLWFKDMISESTFQGLHTKATVSNLSLGFILFIVSEILLFFTFFWAFFHSSLSPSINIGCLWPPLGITPLNPYSMPLLNTAILLSSGFTVTWCHHSIMNGNSKMALNSLLITMMLGVVFTLFQIYEYFEAPFCMADSVYGSTFFMTTGFHGFHVIMGTMFLTVCLLSLYKYHFTTTHHFGFEAASWYWHFVDVMWLFLYMSMYWWGS